MQAIFERTRPSPQDPCKPQKERLEAAYFEDHVDVQLSVNGVPVNRWTKSLDLFGLILKWGGWEPQQRQQVQQQPHTQQRKAAAVKDRRVRR